MRRLFTIALLLGALTGCATPVADWRNTHTEPKRSAQLIHCLDFFDELDAAVKAAKVADAQWARVPGFPYLRASRFLASFRDEVTEPGAGAAFADWTARLRALDQRARRIEIANLPRAARQGLGPDPLAEADRCGDALMASDLAGPTGRAALGRLARVPDHYEDWQRVIGLYPLSALPFAWGSFAWREDQIERFGTRQEDKTVVTYGPAHEASLDAGGVAAILSASMDNTLGIPDPAPDNRDRLFAAFAPVLKVTPESGADRIGAIEWREGRAAVDISRPMAYRLLSHARVGDRVLLQLNYVFWFPERPSSGWFDLLAGHLDGLIWRVTLSPDGRPLIYDSIHPCGCYHLFFPARPPTRTAKMTRTDMWSVWNEGAAEPGVAPVLAPGERMVVHLAPGTHYITALSVTSDPGGVAYDLLPYDRLRSLPLSDGGPDGGRRSMFSPSGLVEGTARGERFFFWPMGIASAGAMRQWGTHATAFVGKRHFDDPFLLEESYDLPSLEGEP